MGVRLPAPLGEPVHRRLQHVRRLGRVLVEQRRAGHAREQQLQVVDGRQAVRELLLDRLALLRHPQVAVQCRRVDRLHEPVLGPAAARHRSPTAVQEPDPDARLASGADERGLGAVETPEARKDAAVLVAVAVADDDLLNMFTASGPLGPSGLAALLFEAPARHRMPEECPEDLRASLEVLDRLEQRHHRQPARQPRSVVRRQAHFAGEQIHAEQVGRAARHADDERAQAVRAVVAHVIRQHAEGRQGRVGLRTRRQIRAEKRPRRRQLAIEELQPALFGPARVVGRLEPGGPLQLPDRAFVKRAVLADVERRQMKPERLRRPNHRRDGGVRHAPGTDGDERLLQQPQIGDEFGGALVPS